MSVSAILCSIAGRREDNHCNIPQFPDLSLDWDRSHPQAWPRRTRGLDWWPPDSQNMFSQRAPDGLQIPVVTCEDTPDLTEAEDDTLDLGLENLCLAVTEQALE